MLLRTNPMPVHLPAINFDTVPPTHLKVQIFMESQQLKNILEAALLAAGEPRNVDQLRALFGDDNLPEKQDIRSALKSLQQEYENRGIELREVASGFRVQVRESMSHWLARLWEERPPRYSRALMETLAIIAYRQPVTRGDVEEIRGVAVTSNIIRTLLERNWIKVVGHRDVPGKPAMFGTTREFLDYFGLQKLDDLPPLAELARLEPVSVQLDLGTADQENGGEGALVVAGGVTAGSEATTALADADPNVAEALEADGLANESPAAAIAAGDDDEDDFEDDDFDDEDDEDDDDDDDFDDEDEDDDEEDEDFEFDDDEDDDEAEYRGVGASTLMDVDEDDQSISVPPGAATPLVALRPKGVPAPQAATVSSLDEARAAAGVRRAEEPLEDAAGDALDDQPAGVVPRKSS
jgi:segregation and condensation protein B